MDRPEDRPPFRSDDEIEQMVRQFRMRAKRAPVILLGALALVFVLWIASGIYIVQPGEQGVVTMFGRYIGTTSPGVNYRLPSPMQGVTIVNVQNVRRVEVGFRSTGPVRQTQQAQQPQQGQRVLEEALMLTRDENIVEIGMLVQYRIKDAAAFVFRVQDPEEVLHTSIEVALRSAVGRMPIDAVITERRAEVQENSRVYLEGLLDAYDAGIQVTDVRLQTADAPDQVRDSFHEVVRAREDRETKINQSQAYREDIVPRARGDAAQILQQASAYTEERVRQARGESARFLAVLKEYQAAPAVTRERMYIEAMERTLSKVDKVLLGANQGSVLPFLPLRGTPGQSASPAPAPAPSTQPPPQQPRVNPPSPAPTVSPQQQPQRGNP